MSRDCLLRKLNPDLLHAWVKLRQIGWRLEQINELTRRTKLNSICGGTTGSLCTMWGYDDYPHRSYLWQPPPHRVVTTRYNLSQALSGWPRPLRHLLWVRMWWAGMTQPGCRWLWHPRSCTFRPSMESASVRRTIVIIIYFVFKFCSLPLVLSSQGQRN